MLKNLKNIASRDETEPTSEQKTLHHSNQFLVIANYPHTGMLCHHVRSHLPSRDFDKVQLLLLEHSVPHKMVPGQDLLRASVVHRVVHDVQCWLAVHEHLNRYSHPIFPLHLELELAQKTDLLCCC